MVEVTIDSIRVGLMSQQRVVILREVGADRYLAIWVDPYMAEQITFALQDVEVARPMSHDLIKNMLNQMGARVVRVEVIELKDDVFYGNIVVEHEGEMMDIDSRPSDALALAVRVNVPIFVARAVMEEAGITPEEDMGEQEGESAPEMPLSENGGDGEGEEDEERLSVFEDFLDNLELGGKDAPGEEDDDED
ncbi:MAG: bifunctional nuclease family protein [Anaerolineae bacterium]|nr:MAG: bifunctional nuclease family protein [Anaerolineae bacterium]